MYPYLKINDFQIPFYWIFMMIGIISSIVVLYLINRTKKILESQDLLYSILFGICGGILGAKIMYLITSIPIMIEDPRKILPLIFEGGLVFYGGLIFGVIAIMYYIKSYGLNPVKILDLFALVLPLGHAFGRVGCFMAGCCYGLKTDKWYGVYFKYSVDESIRLTKVVPIQIIEAIFLIVIFVILLIAYFKFYKPFLIIKLYLFLYGVLRFIIEFFRDDDYRGIAILSTSQWISLICILTSILLWIPTINKIKFFHEEEPYNKKYLIYKKEKDSYGTKTK